MRISIIIPTRNEEENIGQLLKSIRENDYPTDQYEIIVVDGKSSDNTVKIAKSYGAKVIIQSKLGVANAKNIGYKLAEGEIVAGLDCDATVALDYLAEIEKAFEDPEVHCIRPLIIPQAKNIFQKIMCCEIKLSGHRSKAQEWPTIFRKSVLERIGGFDEDMGYGEDREFPERIKKFNLWFKFTEEVVVYSKPTQNIFALWQEGLWYGRNYLAYLSKTKDIISAISFTAHIALPLLFLIAMTINNFYVWTITILIKFIVLMIAVKGFAVTKSIWAFGIPIIKVIRSWAMLIGMIKGGHKGR